MIWPRSFAVLAAFCAVYLPLLNAQQSSAVAAASVDSTQNGNKVVLILPFQNDSKAPGLEWIGEAFAEILGQRMQSESTFVISREDRLYAFDRVGIPANARLSRATLLLIAQQMDVDYVVLGSYTYDGNTFSAKAQLLDMRRLHLSPSVTESGSLLQLIDIQASTSWDMIRQIRPDIATTKQDFVAETKDIRLDALENYVRGVIASDKAEKVRRFKEAVRLNPNYSVAMLQLGKVYFDDRDYMSAMTWFSRVPLSDKNANEANFFLGLSAFYAGNLDRAAEAFRFVAARLPLTEVYNNLGVVEARRKKTSSLEYLERAVEADPTDPDYHFNLALSLARIKDSGGAVRQLKEALALRPTDSEAKAYLETLSSSSTSPARPPIERIKRNYDEASFRQLAFAIENAQESQMAHSDPKKHAAMHVDQGKQQLRQGFYEQARDHFRKALALDPENVDAHVGLAAAQIALNDFSGARNELDTMLRSQPTSEAYVTLGQLDLKENKLDAANEAVAQALRLEPGNSAALELKQQLASKLNVASPQNQ
ncbi:MAG TPA: tetratricopeptide repeat protein [Terriglobales bacterium]|nr:tetratricopeptide repeat protein [Terriglobales bacterium]